MGFCFGGFKIFFTEVYLHYLSQTCLIIKYAARFEAGSGQVCLAEKS